MRTIWGRGVAFVYNDEYGSKISGCPDCPHCLAHLSGTFRGQINNENNCHIQWILRQLIVKDSLDHSMKS